MTHSGKPPVPFAYRFVVALIRPLLMVLTKRDWQGAENLPSSGGFVVAPNHLSYVDPLVFGHFMYDHGRAPFFLGKEGVFRVPVLGALLRSAEQIPVYRNTGRAADAFRAAVAAVEGGKCIAVYPEGTLTRDPQLWPMVGKTGAARIALATRCPVIPVAQWGPQEMLAPYGKRLRLLPRRTMHVRAGRPVDLSDLYDVPMTGAVSARRDRTDHGGAHRGAGRDSRRGSAGGAVRLPQARPAHHGELPEGQEPAPRPEQ